MLLRSTLMLVVVAVCSKVTPIILSFTTWLLQHLNAACLTAASLQQAALSCFSKGSVRVRRICCSTILSSTDHDYCDYLPYNHKFKLYRRDYSGENNNNWAYSWHYSGESYNNDHLLSNDHYNTSSLLLMLK